jgi:DNA-binding winged helix-turn-helix (wHTH) protein
VAGINQPDDKSVPYIGVEDDVASGKKLTDDQRGLTGNPGSRPGTSPGRANECAQSSARLVCFGPFEGNLQTRLLRKNGMRIRLEEKPFQILEMLLERAGEVVTRKTLSEKLWPSTHVGYEHGLNTAVNKLRGLLGDSAQSPRFVETLPRLGYRFIAPVSKSPVPALQTGSSV